MAAIEILPIPEIPAALRVAATNGTIVPFVGAGPSVSAGGLDLDGLAKGGLEHCIKAGHFSHARLEQTRHLSARVRLTIAKSLANDHHLDLPLKTLLKGVETQSDIGRQLYRSIGRLGKNSIVTTNYDNWLDYDLLQEDTTWKPTSAAPALTRRRTRIQPHEHTAYDLTVPNTVFHLHGSLEKEDEMVLSTQDYLRHYRADSPPADENPLVRFLEDLFRDRTILFIGYGLGDLEILEYALLKSRLNKKPHEAPKHFILQGFFKYEEDLADAMGRYYAECGIGLLAYSRDVNNYNQLVTVLDYYATNLVVEDLATLEELELMK